MWEVQDVFLECEVTGPGLVLYRELVTELASLDAFSVGAKKAQRAYKTRSSSITKPSYYGRIREYGFKKLGANDPTPIDQLALLTEKFREMPQASNLQISIFHPQDLIDQFRPGYVPCLSFIDVKYRGGELCLKAYFRSCDVGEVAPFDLLHLCEIMDEIASEFERTSAAINIERKRIVLMFSRIFAYKRRLHVLDSMDAVAATFRSRMV